MCIKTKRGVFVLKPSVCEFGERMFCYCFKLSEELSFNCVTTRLLVIIICVFNCLCELFFSPVVNWKGHLLILAFWPCAVLSRHNLSPASHSHSTHHHKEETPVSCIQQSTASISARMMIRSESSTVLGSPSILLLDSLIVVFERVVPTCSIWILK